MRPVLKRIPLTARVALVAAGLMVLLGIVASQQVLRTLGLVQTERIRELATTHVEALSVALGPLVLRNDVWEVYDTLERAASASSKGRIAFTAVSDASGQVLAASDPFRAPTGSPFEALAQEAQALAGLNFSGSQATIRLTAPLVFQGRRVGRIATELNVADLVAERARVARLLVLWNAIATGGLALVGFFAMRRMMAPVTTLAEKMSVSAEAPEPITDRDLLSMESEFGRLARTYNTMANAVREKAEAERRLAERERFVSLGRLSSSLAHEINNPLGGLLNATDTIQTYADNPEVVRKSTELLERGLRHLRDVVRVTLEQNRIDRAGSPAGPDDFEDLQLLIGPEIRRRAQNFVWEIEVGQVTLARFPSAQLRQILLNLLLNACSAAGQGGEVSLRATEEETGLRLRIVDSGPGLDDAARQRLLSSDPVPPGGGVGLRLVHDLVHDMNGKIEVQRTGGANAIELVLPYAKEVDN
ncbi:Sensor protein ZraS [Roseovarius litorisediminis]|uniref:histidine kinase n=1 Tax=Roseovarius litorisediminis TaxID=1312363 RepID=A0A1Y5RC09_9RHOB|nr:Sensor protein ZraS [Roseovarius litorisediminis]